MNLSQRSCQLLFKSLEQGLTSWCHSGLHSAATHCQADLSLLGQGAPAPLSTEEGDCEKVLSGVTCEAAAWAEAELAASRGGNESLTARLEDRHRPAAVPQGSPRLCSLQKGHFESSFPFHRDPPSSKSLWSGGMLWSLPAICHPSLILGVKQHVWKVRSFQTAKAWQDTDPAEDFEVGGNSSRGPFSCTDWEACLYVDVLIY